jgi:hypothetical protein
MKLTFLLEHYQINSHNPSSDKYRCAIAPPAGAKKQSEAAILGPSGWPC